MSVLDYNSDTSIPDEEMYEVERVQGKRIRYGGIEYRIKWKNYPEDDNTWEPINHLACTQLLQEYEANYAECNELLPWVPEPVEIINHQYMDDGNMDYLVRWTDGIESWVNLTFGPMNPLIAEYEKNRKKLSKKKPYKPAQTIKRKSMVAADESDESDDKIHQIKRIAYKWDRDIATIHDMKRSMGDIFYLVEYKDDDDLDWVSRQILRKSNPIKIIEFYEKCITWETDTE